MIDKAEQNNYTQHHHYFNITIKCNSINYEKESSPLFLTMYDKNISVHITQKSHIEI